ncbi:MAG: SLC13/DASS family transporter [Bacteroidetes bacterium]|nr:SLC13/DASS family transporter [Bacteroidota bacterium]
MPKQLKYILFSVGLGLLAWALVWQNHDFRIAAMAGVTVLMAALWITEAIPLGATSLLPIGLFPMLGIANVSDVTAQYGHHIIFLFLAGFILAYAMEKWKLHQRIAFKIIGVVGFSPSRILLGFMLASFVLSMWISNLATTILLLAPALAVIQEVNQKSKNGSAFAIALLLGISYASSIGGTATPLGTAPNLIFMSLWEENFKDVKAIGFPEWMRFALPVSIILFIPIFWHLKRSFGLKDLEVSANDLKAKVKSLTKMTYEEIVVSAIFLALIALWLTRRDLDLGLVELQGWGDLFPYSDMIKDSTIGILLVNLLFFIPSKQNAEKQIIEWGDVKKLPYEILLLFGGGFSLALGFKESGLDKVIASQLEPLATWPLWLIILGICLFVTFLTEITSNTATTQLLLPLLIIMANTTGVNPLYLMVPATLSASFAFMLPVATPPNAIVYSTEMIPMKTMMRTGLILNFIAALILTVLAYFFTEILI